VSVDITSLLEGLAAAHAVLGVQPKATEGERDALDRAREALAEVVKGLDPALLGQSPGDGEWSVLQVLEHVLEHDRKTEEVQTRGLLHYAEHLQEHREHILRILGGFGA